MLNFLIARLPSSLACRSKTQLGFLHRNASHIFSSFYSVVKSSELNQSTRKQEGNESYTISYLMNSCGLSIKEAIQASKRVKLRSLENPDSVLNLLKSYGFSKTHISKLVKRHPPVLLINTEKTLLPKLRYFKSIGYSDSQLPEILSTNSRFLTGSLEKHIIPIYEALKSVLHDEMKVKIALKYYGWIFVSQDLTNLVPNVETLRKHGVPQSSITLLVTKYAKVAFMKAAEFVEHVKFTKEIGIEPSRTTFVRAIYVLAVIKKSNWESKFDIFERFGWSRDVTLSVFKMYPACMTLSEEKITNTMKFLVDEMGLSLEKIARHPAFLGYSLKQRIVPRCSVVKILKMKGLMKDGVSLYSIMTMSENTFMGKFVIRFHKIVPELLKIYGGKFRPLPEVQT